MRCILSKLKKNYIASFPYHEVGNPTAAKLHGYSIAPTEKKVVALLLGVTPPFSYIMYTRFRPKRQPNTSVTCVTNTRGLGGI